MLIDLKLICSINFVQFSALNENVAQFRTLNENGENIFICWLSKKAKKPIFMIQKLVLPTTKMLKKGRHQFGNPKTHILSSGLKFDVSGLPN